MRLHGFFNNKYTQMRKDLKGIVIPMAIKIKLLNEIQDTVMLLKKVFQDNKDIDQRSLISGICKVVQASSALRVTFLVKFLKDLPRHNVDTDYIVNNFRYLKDLTTHECSQLEKNNIMKDTKK